MLIPDKLRQAWSLSPEREPDAGMSIHQVEAVSNKAALSKKSQSWLVASKKVVQEDKIGPAFIYGQGATILKVDSYTPASFAERLAVVKEEDHCIDAKDFLVSPAFINGHTHIAMNIFRQVLGSKRLPAANMIEDLFFALESHLEAADVRAFSRIGALENVFNGVGLVWDHYYHGLSVAEACREVGLPAVIAPTLQDLSGPGQSRWEEELAGTLALNDPSWAGAQIFSALGPHASDTVSASLWERLIDVAETKRLPIHMHLAQTIDEVRRSHERHGKSPVRWLDDLGLWRSKASCLAVHSIYMTKADLDLLDPKRHVLGFCPFSQMIFAQPAPVWEWEAKGLPWLIATDCVASNDSMNVQKELRLTAGLPRIARSFGSDFSSFMDTGDVASLLDGSNDSRFIGWKGEEDPAWLLSKVWQIPGRMHSSFKVGKIAPGYMANLAFWDESHPSLWPQAGMRGLAMADGSGALAGLMLGGHLTGWGEGWQERLKADLAYDAMVEEAEHRLEALCKRVGL